ncbi:MAG: hypothetical protein ACREFH_09285 [Stellaceae bacterium]
MRRAKTELPGIELPGIELPGIELPGIELPGPRLNHVVAVMIDTLRSS